MLKITLVYGNNSEITLMSMLLSRFRLCDKMEYTLVTYLLGKPCVLCHKCVKINLLWVLISISLLALTPTPFT